MGPLGRPARTLVLCLALLMASCSGNSDTTTTSGGTEEDTATVVTKSASITIPGEDFSEIDEQIEQHMAEADLPSLSAAMVVNDEVVWARGYGDQPDLDTVYMIGSIAKPFVATAVLQLVEQGRLELDAAIGDYLPFVIRHPDDPDTAITIRMLLNHRSGLAHDLPASIWWDNDQAMLEWMGDNLDLDLTENPFAESRPSLREYLEYFLSPDAVDTESGWVARPGTDYQYSNIAFTQLLDYVIEQVTGQPLAAYVNENIFAPLGMINSSYEASDFRQGQLAVPYTRFADGDRMLPITGMAASGPLRTTASDLARFLAAHMNQGSLGEVRILEPESVEFMHSRLVPMSGFDFPQHSLNGQGAGWALWGEQTSGHSGGVPGFFSEMVMQELDNGTVGVVLMVNLGCSLRCDQDVFDSHFAPIREMLLEQAASLLEG